MAKKGDLDLDPNLALTEAVPSPSGRWDGMVGAAALKSSILWDECLPVKQSHVEWDASSCLFFPGLFFQAGTLACWVFFDT